MPNTYSYFDVVEAANSLARDAEDALETSPSEAQLMMQHAQFLASLVLAEQQRLANVIALATAMRPGDPGALLNDHGRRGASAIDCATDRLDPVIRRWVKGGLGFGTFRPDLGDVRPATAPSAPAADAEGSEVEDDERSS